MVAALTRELFAAPPETRAEWQALVSKGGLQTLANSDVLAAIDCWKSQDRELANALYDHLVRMVAKVLRQQISRGLPEGGWPVIERSAAMIKNAISDPGHDHGLWIRKNFSRYVKWRTLTNLKKWVKEVEGSTLSLDDVEKMPALLGAYGDRLSRASHEDAVIAAVDRDRLKATIEKIDDLDKRLVLLLAVIYGDTGEDAAEAAGVKPGTARKWIRSFKQGHEVDDRGT